MAHQDSRIDYFRDQMGRKITTLFFLLPLCCSFSHCSIAEKKVSSVIVFGTVICDSCFHQEFSKSGQFITGASVAVEVTTTKPSFRKLVKTNQLGVFRVRLPPQIDIQVKSIQSCSVTLIKSSHTFCTVTSSATSRQLRLKSRRNRVHIFSAGLFTFKPMKQTELCNQKPMVKVQPAFFFPPSIPFLPPPSIGGVPLPPNPFQPPLLPPIPLLPSPPPLLPPIPFFPSPPPLLPPLPFQPAPPPFFSLPPIPFLTPPPPPPSFLFPPFPFPFPPNPLFPGIPPASHSEESASP